VECFAAKAFSAIVFIAACAVFTGATPFFH
jgi:hypothetical protein